MKYIEDKVLNKMSKKRIKAYRTTIYREIRHIEGKYICDCCGELNTWTTGETKENLKNKI